MCLVNEEQAMFGNKRLFTEEQLANAWNKRAESTCEWHRCEETDEWVCHKCGGSLAGCMFDPVRDGFVCVPNFCPNCGEKVVK